MASPSPRAVVKLSAKTETLVTSVITFSTMKVPTIEMAPMTSGSNAATRPRKMNSSSSSVIGQRDHLRHLEVVLSGGADLAEHLGHASHPHRQRLERPGIGRLQLLDALAHLFVGSRDAGDDQRLVGVAAAQRGGAAEAPVRRDVGHVGLAGEPRGQGSAGLGHPGCVHRGRARVRPAGPGWANRCGSGRRAGAGPATSPRTGCRTLPRSGGWRRCRRRRPPPGRAATW